LAPPPAEYWSAQVGAPARQPDLVRASRKTDGGAAEGSSMLLPILALFARISKPL